MMRMMQKLSNYRQRENSRFCIWNWMREGEGGDVFCDFISCLLQNDFCEAIFTS